ncbi:MAG: hypothetical protein IID37_04880 [Planctomycetes bacterium]|nr:hypothetical protein [Planctomycetota bacterium]
MTELMQNITERERELSAIIEAYNQVTERLKSSHEQLGEQVGRLRRELEDKNRELARQERLTLLGEMAAGIAHEIRNPLSSILLFSTMLERAASNGTDCCSLAGKVVTGVRTLEGIVGDILAFAGSDVDGSAHFVETDLCPIVRDVVALASVQAEAKSATVATTLPSTPVTVIGHATQLRRAILNLTLNAVEAVDDGGRVRVTLRHDPVAGWVRCSVTDNGPGVPQQWIERIYDPFFTTKPNGTGLGLAIVHRIARSHGAELRVDNLSTGGAEFTLSFRAAIRSKLARDVTRPSATGFQPVDQTGITDRLDATADPIDRVEPMRRIVNGVPVCH